MDEEEVKIQLASLLLEGTALIWWEIKLQKVVKKNGNIRSSWSKFTFALKKQLYPLGYTQKAITEWKNLRWGKWKSVQNFTK
jgi:hypothetical protein